MFHEFFTKYNIFKWPSKCIDIYLTFVLKCQIKGLTVKHYIMSSYSIYYRRYIMSSCSNYYESNASFKKYELNTSSLYAEHLWPTRLKIREPRSLGSSVGLRIISSWNQQVNHRIHTIRWVDRDYESLDVINFSLFSIHILEFKSQEVANSIVLRKIISRSHQGSELP